MKSVILFATSLLALTTLCPPFTLGQTTPPRPVVRPVPQVNQTPPPTAKNPAGTSVRQDGRPQPTQYPVAATNLRPVMSIEDVQFQPPIIKVLVRNRGKQKNKPGEIAKLYISLRRGNKAKPSESAYEDMSFWVTGKPEPYTPGLFSFGQGTPLTQQDIDALPPTTKIKQPFKKIIPLPLIAPGESVWVSTDFTLPDPGTYAPSPKGPPIPGLPTPPNTSWIDASQMPECYNLAAFFASYIRVEMLVDFRRTPSESTYPWPPVDPPVNYTYGRQLPQSFFNFMNIPPGKYDGKCK